MSLATGICMYMSEPSGQSNFSAQRQLSSGFENECS